MDNGSQCVERFLECLADLDAKAWAARGLLLQCDSIKSVDSTLDCHRFRIGFGPMTQSSLDLLTDIEVKNGRGFGGSMRLSWNADAWTIEREIVEYRGPGPQSVVELPAISTDELDELLIQLPKGQSELIESLRDTVLAAAGA